MDYENKTWHELIHFLKGRKIALFGNAKSVLNKEKEIDSQYDVICRMNLGFVKGHEKYIGSKTDVLFLSMPIQEERLRQLNPKFIIWCTPKQELMTPHLQKHALTYSKVDWYRLFGTLKARPSTGVMAFDILINIGCKQLDLYGFDHWKSVTWYNDKNRPSHHNPETEEKYINWNIDQYKGRIIKND